MKEKIMAWIDNHPKNVLLGMFLVLFIGLVSLIISQFLRKPTTVDALKKLKETGQKAKQLSKSSYGEITDVNDLYQKSKTIMQKDSLTKEDYAYLKMVDSTLKSIIKKR